MGKSPTITQVSICTSLSLLQILGFANQTVKAEEKFSQKKNHRHSQKVETIESEKTNKKIEKLLALISIPDGETSAQKNQRLSRHLAKNRSLAVSLHSPEHLDGMKRNFSTKAADLLPRKSQELNSIVGKKGRLEPLEKLPIIIENIDNINHIFEIAKYENEIEQLINRRRQISRIQEKLKQNINYISPPQVVSKKKAPPILTTFSLNNLTVNHLTKEIVDGQVIFGDDRSTNTGINALYPIGNRIIQSLSRNNIFTSDFRGDYLQLRTVNRERQVSINQSIPQTMKGLETQQTFIGPCEILNEQVTDSNQQCTYLPPLVTERNSIEPQFFIPTQIAQMGKLGDVISPETLAIIKQPGWQNIGADGEFTGIDLYFPNIGTIPGNTQSTRTLISRREDIDTTYKLGHYRVRQIVKANAEKAVIGRTIRGMGAIVDSDDFFLYPALGAVAQMLPDLEPDIEGLPAQVNTNINKNLFNAANNIRTPLSSFVVYQAGMGEAKHRPRNRNQNNSRNNNSIISKLRSHKTHSNRIPSASFNSLWIGFSPVTERSISQDFRYVTVGEEKQVTRVGGEGGIDSDINFIVAANENRIASVELDNFYIQAYMSFLERDVNFMASSTLTEKTNYYPHLSFSGNITNYNSVLRYYSGVITTKNPKFYLGADYTQNWQDWLFNIGAIAYENGDKDYFSKAEGSLRRNIKLSRNANLGLFSEFRYAWERDRENFLDDPVDNFASIGANFDIKNFSLRISQLLDVLPNAVGNKLQGSLTAKFSKNGSITAYLSPQRNIDNYGISASYNWLRRNFTSSLIFNWNRGIYDFGRDDFDNELITRNNTFTLIFKSFFK